MQSYGPADPLDPPNWTLNAPQVAMLTKSTTFAVGLGHTGQGLSWIMQLLPGGAPPRRSRPQWRRPLRAAGPIPRRGQGGAQRDAGMRLGSQQRKDAPGTGGPRRSPGGRGHAPTRGTA